MPTQQPAGRVKAISLRLFIVSILATGVVGAVAIMMPAEGWWLIVQLRILATTSILTGASVCGLIGGGCYAMGRRTLPTVGMALVALATLLGLALTWEQVPALEAWKPTAVATTLGVGCTHMSMLLMMKLHRSYQWVQGLAYFLILGLASFISLVLITEAESLATFQAMGVMSIAATAVSLVIPVLSYLSRHKLDEEGETAAALIKRITRLRDEMAELEERLAQLPPAAPTSPWDDGATKAVAGGPEETAPVA